MIIFINSLPRCKKKLNAACCIVGAAGRGYITLSGYVIDVVLVRQSFVRIIFLFMIYAVRGTNHAYRVRRRLLHFVCKIPFSLFITGRASLFTMQ